MFIFIHLQVKQRPTLRVFDVDSGGRGERARSGETRERQQDERGGNPQKFPVRPRLEADACDALSLKVGTTVLRGGRGADKLDKAGLSLMTSKRENKSFTQPECAIRNRRMGARAALSHWAGLKKTVV